MLLFINHDIALIPFVNSLYEAYSFAVHIHLTQSFALPSLIGNSLTNSKNKEAEENNPQVRYQEVVKSNEGVHGCHLDYFGSKVRIGIENSSHELLTK